LGAGQGGFEQPVIAHRDLRPEDAFGGVQQFWEGSGGSLTEPLERLGVAGQFFVEHAVQQLGTAVVFHIPSFCVGGSTRKDGLCGLR
jgi:hypothetical protein